MLDVLILGCGNCRIRRIKDPDRELDFSDSKVTTIDMDPNCKPDIRMSLDGLGSRSLIHPFGKRLPFKDDSFDEIHAYDVIEHLGRQGDWKGYFREFGEYHRILKPGGRMFILVGNKWDNFADPGHTRFFSSNHFGMLNQKFYQDNIDKGTSCADYRWFWKKNFNIRYFNITDHHIGVSLEKA